MKKNSHSLCFCCVSFVHCLDHSLCLSVNISVSVLTMGTEYSGDYDLYHRQSCVIPRQREDCLCSFSMLLSIEKIPNYILPPLKCMPVAV